MIYTFFCDNCHIPFEISCQRTAYTSNQQCPSCGGNKVYRDFEADLPDISVKLADSEIKTLGHLSERNNEKFSDDKKEELTKKHNKYRNKRKPKLGRGMSYVERQEGVEWTEQKKKRRAKKR